MFIKIGTKKVKLMGLRSQASDYFGLNLPSQLVIGYHWLASLNQVRRVEDAVVKVPNSVKILSTKSTISI